MDGQKTTEERLQYLEGKVGELIDVVNAVDRRVQGLETYRDALEECARRQNDEREARRRELERKYLEGRNPRR